MNRLTLPGTMNPPLTLDVAFGAGSEIEHEIEGPDEGSRRLVVTFAKWPHMIRGLRALGTVPPWWCYMTYTVDGKFVRYKVRSADGDDQTVEAVFEPEGIGTWRSSR